jgi:hypothetical protein
MANKEARVGDSGVPLVVVAKVDGVVQDISAATAMVILIKRPRGGTRRETGAFTTDGTDGKTQFVTDANTLDTPGRWEVQARITTPSFTVTTEADVLEVQEAAT